MNGQLNKLQRKGARKRDDATHQASRKLADTAHTVVVEDLNTKGMTKSAKGTVAKLPQSNDELANRLHHACRCLRTDPFYARAFQAYQERMFVGQTSPRLSFELAVDNFEQLGLRLLAI